jgi:hypothetical protein
MFDDFDLPALASGLEWEINPGDVTVFLSVVAALAGDYNFNGVVDAADYTVWRDSLGQMGTGLAADGNNNQIVDEPDYAVWKDHFGETLSGSGSDFVQETAVPEPSGLLLSVLAIAGIHGFRRHRRSVI